MEDEVILMHNNFQGVALILGPTQVAGEYVSVVTGAMYFRSLNGRRDRNLEIPRSLSPRSQGEATGVQVTDDVISLI